MSVIAVRIIRHRGSQFAVLQGGTRHFESIKALMNFARKQHKVFAFIDLDNAKQGLCRSGRMMRRVDLIVKNVGSSFEALEFSTPAGMALVRVPSAARFE